MRCYYKILSESTSKEGEQYKTQFPIDFKKCYYKCSGYKGCEKYIPNGKKLEDMLKDEKKRT
jgi:hypothetical protein